MFLNGFCDLFIGFTHGEKGSQGSMQLGGAGRLKVR